MIIIWVKETKKADTLQGYLPFLYGGFKHILVLVYTIDMLLKAYKKALI